MKSPKKFTILVLALGLMVCLAQVSEGEPMSSSITYQGRLMDRNRPADGLYDFQFRLYDSNDPCTGTQLGDPIDINNLDVIDGHFIVDLDFGNGIFDGNAVWLETRVVHSPMGSAPATLSPLLELTPTPYAVYAQTAGAGHSLDAADGSPTDSVYVDDNGNVGIGTTSPGVKLDVAGYINAADYYLLNNNVLVYSPAASGAFFYGWDASVKRHIMSTEGEQRLVIDNSGNVGIGTTSPSTTLDVAGTVNATAFVGDGSGLTDIAGDSDWTISGNDMYSIPSGNVGIGTTNPLSKLSVGGDGIVNIGVYGVGSYAGVYGRDSDTGAYGYFGFNTVGVYGGGSDFGVYGGGSDYGVYGYGPGTGVYGLDTISGSYGHIGYDAWGGYFSGDGYFSGNVGIGTTSPSTKLDVSGIVNATAFVGDGSGLTGIAGDLDWIISGNDMYSIPSGNVGIGTTSPDSDLHVQGYGNREIKVESLDASFPRFTLKNYRGEYRIILSGDLPSFGGGNLEFYNGSVVNFVLTKDGNVGVGTTSPSAKLDVNGDININSTYKIGGSTVLSVPDTNNTFVGVGAGENNISKYGTFVGYNAGYNNEGHSNTFLGSSSGYLNTSGYQNTFVGRSAGYSNTTGNSNTFLGLGAGRWNTEGRSNTFLGHWAGYSNTTGYNNTFLGPGAGFSNTEGYLNIFLGPSAGYHNTTGTNNTFIGASAGYHNTRGTNNAYLGANAGYENTTGDNNTYLGYNAGKSNTTGTGNVFIGYQAGYFETGSNKLYIANQWLGDPLIYGDFVAGNVGIGTEIPSAKLDVNGDINISSNYKIGRSTVLSVTETNNTFLGIGAGESTTGSGNTFLGNYAGNRNSIGTGNVFIGYGAGYYETGSNKLYIANGFVDANTLIYGDFSTGRVGIGTTSPGAELEVNGEIRISPDSGSVLKVGRHSSSSPSAYIDTENANQMRLQVNGSTKMAIGTSGNVGIGTTSPASRLHVAGGCITGSMCSDIRLKKNIEPLPLDDSILDRVMGLKAVTFEWKRRDDGKRQIGLIAQDVEEVFPEVVTTPDDESCEKGLLATGLDAVLVEAIKELKAENELLKERLEDLERTIHQLAKVKELEL